MYKQSPTSRLLSSYLFSKSWMTAIVILALSIVVSGTIIALPRPYAVRAASATITINPTSQMYFSRSTINVKGTNFKPNETVNVYWDYHGSSQQKVTSANANGSGSFSQGFIMPLGPAGPHTIGAVGQSSGSVATAIFTMLPNLIASPRAIGVGSSFSITGQAFGAGEKVNIYWNCQGNCTGNPLATPTADNTGSFQFTANVPSGTYWRVPITGIGQSSKTTALAKIIVYKPTLALAPLSGPAGTPLTISSYGFRTHEHVDVYWNNGNTPIFAIQYNTRQLLYKDRKPK